MNEIKDVLKQLKTDWLGQLIGKLIDLNKANEVKERFPQWLEVNQITGEKITIDMKIADIKSGIMASRDYVERFDKYLSKTDEEITTEIDTIVEEVKSKITQQQSGIIVPDQKIVIAK
jgi:hypothetical protein